MRDPYLDNAKFVLIVLVVFGHFLEPILDRSFLAHSLYVWIYLFHMPAFIFLAGVTTRLESTRANVRRLLGMLAIFQILYSIEGFTFRTGIAFPYWILWFLLSLLYWRVVASLLAGRIPQGWFFAGTVFISALAGYLPFGYTLSIKRTLVFAPFFFVGLFWGQRILSRLRARSLAFSIVALAVLIIAYVQARGLRFDLTWLHGTLSFADLSGPTKFPWAGRLLLLVIGFALSFAALILLPSRRTWFTQPGKATLVIYLAHGLIVMPLRNTIAHASPLFAWLIIVTATLGVVAVFSSNFAGKIFAFLVRDRAPQEAPAS